MTVEQWANEMGRLSKQRPTRPTSLGLGAAVQEFYRHNQRVVELVLQGRTLNDPFVSAVLTVAWNLTWREERLPHRTKTYIRRRRSG